MSEMANCARCGASTPTSRGTYTEDGLICQACTDSATQKELDATGQLVDAEDYVPGSLPLGFLAGFFGGCIGYLLVHMLAKGDKTKQGAKYGFWTGVVLGIAMRGLTSV